MKPRLASEHYTPRVQIEGLGDITIKRIVAETFIENPEGLGYVVNVDGDIFNNRVPNLRWDKRRYNRGSTGQVHNRSKLSFNDVKEIRDRRQQGESVITLAKAFKTSRHTIYGVIKHKRCFDVNGP